MSSDWQEWVESTERRIQWSESRIQSLQDLSIQWSAWAFKITDRMEHLESRLVNLEERMTTVEAGLEANTTELKRHRSILMAIARRLEIEGLDSV